MGQQHAIHKFVLGTKDFDDKQSEFMYDKGWYSITDIVGEEKNIIYKSRNAQEAYLKWNIYIGRKKERLTPEERKRQREERYEKKNCGGECGIIPHLLVGYVIKLQLVVQRFAVNAQQLCSAALVVSRLP